MIDILVGDLEQPAAITVDHADLVEVAARAGEDDPSAMHASGVG